MGIKQKWDEERCKVVPHKTCRHPVNTAPGELLRHTTPSRLVWQGYNSNYLGIVQRREKRRKYPCLPALFLLLVCWSLFTPQRANTAPNLYLGYISKPCQTLLRNPYSMLHSRAYNPSSKKKKKKTGWERVQSIHGERKKGKLKEFWEGKQDWCQTQ